MYNSRIQDYLKKGAKEEDNYFCNSCNTKMHSSVVNVHFTWLSSQTPGLSFDSVSLLCQLYLCVPSLHKVHQLFQPHQGSAGWPAHLRPLEKGKTQINELRNTKYVSKFT